MISTLGKHKTKFGYNLITQAAQRKAYTCFSIGNSRSTFAKII